jgi:outer membrane lipoprotein-sorting protein
MWLTVRAVLVAADPGSDSPEAVFKRMEQPILKCKTFQADVEIGVGPGKDNLLKGRLLVAQGNKMRLELDGSIMGKPGKMAMVSDGSKMRMTGDTGPGKDQDTPKQLSEIALASLTRTGVFVPMFLIVEVAEPGKKPEPFDLDKQFAVSDVKLGKKEMASGKETQALDYRLTTKTGKEPLAATVWIDVKTNLPVKRVVTVKEGKETITVTETYAKASLDDKIDNKEFELPQ